MGPLLALMLTETHLQFRQAKLEYTSSIINSRDLLNQSHRQGIIERGRDAMISGVLANAMNGVLSGAGGAASLKSHSSTSSAMKDYGDMAPAQKATVESLKTEILELEGQPKPDAGKLKAMRDTLAEEQSKLDTMEGQYNQAQHDAMKNNLHGQIMQQMSGSIAGTMQSSGELVNAMNDAANAHSQAAEEQLRELMDSVKDSQHQDQQQLAAMINMMQTLIEHQRALYANV